MTEKKLSCAHCAIHVVVLLKSVKGLNMN